MLEQNLTRLLRLPSGIWRMAFTQEPFFVHYTNDVCGTITVWDFRSGIIRRQNCISYMCSLRTLLFLFHRQVLFFRWTLVLSYFLIFLQSYFYVISWVLNIVSYQQIKINTHWHHARSRRKLKTEKKRARSEPLRFEERDTCSNSIT